MLLPAFVVLSSAAPPAGRAWDYSERLFGPTRTLDVSVADVDRESGTVECSGSDTARPGEPFTWEWGDGETSKGSFPQTHQYKDRSRNYVVKVTAYYPDAKSDTVAVLVRFRPLSPPLKRVRLPSGIRVAVPSKMPHLRAARAEYGVPRNLTVFDDSAFEACARGTVEYVLSVAAAIQIDLANNDVCRDGGRFDQVLLRDPDCLGMYSLWYTDPICFGVGEYAFEGDIQWSSFFHEMGHNVTLNSPADFHWGGKQDGPANTIYSEFLGQVFQHATAYELVNNRERYGISQDLAFDIARSARASMHIVRRAYEGYVNDGCRFCSWNDDDTERDDTFNTFMTIAYKFFEHAEKGQRGYRQPVKRLMAFLQRFNRKWEKAFSADENSQKAEQFRATLMCAALSYAFREDLRAEFRELRFPVDDKVFAQLLNSGTSGRGNRPH